MFGGMLTWNKDSLFQVLLPLIFLTTHYLAPVQPPGSQDPKFWLLSVSDRDFSTWLPVDHSERE